MPNPENPIPESEVQPEKYMSDLERGSLSAKRAELFLNNIESSLETRGVTVRYTDEDFWPELAKEIADRLESNTSRSENERVIETDLWTQALRHYKIDVVRQSGLLSEDQLEVYEKALPISWLGHNERRQEYVAATKRLEGLLSHDNFTRLITLDSIASRVLWKFSRLPFKLYNGRELLQFSDQFLVKEEEAIASGKEDLSDKKYVSELIRSEQANEFQGYENSEQILSSLEQQYRQGKILEETRALATTDSGRRLGRLIERVDKICNSGQRVGMLGNLSHNSERMWLYLS